MSQGERDLLFEKALRRQLRAGELDSGLREDVCPDAEVLAAYHERSLPIEEMSRCKQHIVSCEHCQAILAAVEESEHMPVAMLEPVQARVAQAASVKAEMQDRPRTSGSVKEIKPRGAFKMKWIAPAGAIAAGLLVWIAVQESRHPQLELAPPPKAVGARQEAAPPADSEKLKEDRDGNDLRMKNQTATKIPSSPEPKPILPGADLAQNEPAKIAPFPQKAAPPVNGRTRAIGPSNYAFQQNAIQQNAPQAAGAVGGALPGAATDDQQIAAAGKPEAKAITGMAAAPVAAPPPAPAEPGEENAILDRKAIQQEGIEKQKKEVANQREAANRDVAARNLQDMVSLSTAAVAEQPTAADVIAPDSKSIWRIVGNGKVSHSTDGGKTWKMQNTGVSATLLAGSAPSEKVCWLAGTFGTVLLSTDGGAHWTKLSAPVSVPIAEIHAQDAENAVITLQSSQVQFATYNGGQSWTMLTGKSGQRQ